MAIAETATLDSLLQRPELSAPAKEFARYWQGLPRACGVPLRQDFDPTSLPSILPSFVILEVVDDQTVRIRLAGTAEVERYGHEITGLNYLDFVPEGRKAKALGAFRHILDYPCGMLAKIYSTSNSGEPYINEALGFPVRSSPDQLNLIYFQSNNYPRSSYHDTRNDPLTQHVAVTQRIFVDVGFGVPQDFCE